jgi:hypothetical protein
MPIYESMFSIVIPKDFWYLHLAPHLHLTIPSLSITYLHPNLKSPIASPNQIEESSSNSTTTHNECLKRKKYPTHLHPQQETSLTPPPTTQLMKASFPSGFISMAPAADTDTASLASNATSSKSLSHSGPINAGNDTYNFYDGDGGDGWPGMEQWVDFYSM